MPDTTELRNGDRFRITQSEYHLSVDWPEGSEWEVMGETPEAFQRENAIVSHVEGTPAPSGGFGWTHLANGRRGLYIPREYLLRQERLTDSRESQDGVRVDGPNSITVAAPSGEPVTETREEDGFIITTTRTPIGGGEQQYVRRSAVEEYVEKKLREQGLGHQIADLWEGTAAADSGAYPTIGYYHQVRRHTHDGDEYLNVEDLREWMGGLRSYFGWCGVAEVVMETIEVGLTPFALPFEGVGITARFNVLPDALEYTGYTRQEAATVVNDHIARIVNAGMSVSDQRTISFYVQSNDLER